MERPWYERAINSLIRGSQKATYLVAGQSPPTPSNATQARVGIDELYDAAVETFGKAVARDDVVRVTTREIAAKPEAVAKRGGDRHLAARAILLGVTKLLEKPGRPYDDVICLLTTGVVSAAATIDMSSESDPETLRAKAVAAFTTSFSDSAFKSGMLLEMPNAIALARRHEFMKVATTGLRTSAENLAEARLEYPAAIDFLAGMFIFSSTAVTVGFAQQ